MRVTGGLFRGRNLAIPKGVHLRTTMDQVRQALFNLLGDSTGKKILDLYSGSGALGIEALSRGAAHVTFVDRSHRSVETIQSNLALIYKSKERVSRVRQELPYTVLCSEAKAAIARLEIRGALFDWVFLDPPYGQEEAKICLLALSGHAIVPPLGLVVAEHDKRDRLPPTVIGEKLKLVLQRAVQYGDTALSFYRRPF